MPKKTILVIMGIDAQIERIEMVFNNLISLYGNQVAYGGGTYGIDIKAKEFETFCSGRGFEFYATPPQRDLVPTDREFHCCEILGMLELSREYYRRGYEEVFLIHNDVFFFSDFIPTYREHMLTPNWSFICPFTRWQQTDPAYDEIPPEIDHFSLTQGDCRLTNYCTIFNPLFVDLCYNRYTNIEGIWKGMLQDLHLAADIGFFALREFEGFVANPIRRPIHTDRRRLMESDFVSVFISGGMLRGHKLLFAHDQDLLYEAVELSNYIQPKITNIRELGKGVTDGGFNGCLQRVNDRFLHIYRTSTPDHGTPETSSLHYTWLDKTLAPITGPEKITGLSNSRYKEDPRVILTGESLLLYYHSGTTGEMRISRAVLQVEGNELQLISDESLNYNREVPSPGNNDQEKNWTPFNYKGRELSVYDYSPFILVEYTGDGQCIRPRSLPIILPLYDWKWGKIRGGSPPIKTEDGYLSFFHSREERQGVCSSYYMGAILLNLEPPFNPLRISRNPILFPGIYQSSKPRNDMNVIFPLSAHINGSDICVCSGENDSTIKVIDINYKSLIGTLWEVD